MSLLHFFGIGQGQGSKRTERLSLSNTIAIVLEHRTSIIYASIFFISISTNVVCLSINCNLCLPFLRGFMEWNTVVLWRSSLPAAYDWQLWWNITQIDDELHLSLLSAFLLFSVTLIIQKKRAFLRIIMPAHVRCFPIILNARRRIIMVWVASVDSAICDLI